jgi:lipid-A-disaccharide synthase
MRYYIIAGEASGDLHGSALIRALQRIDNGAEFRFWGGDLMLAAGGTMVRHISKTNFMGFWEVLMNIRTVFENLRMCKKDLARYNPDGLILIDYPGFNMRIARFASKLGIKVFYFISPKVWAWNQSRVYDIKKYVDHMLTIFPFETDFYRSFGYEVDYIGNPLIDAIEERTDPDESFSGFINKNNLQDRPVIAILPGSRLHEIDNCLPIMLSVTGHYKDYQFVIAGAPSVDPGVYARYTGCNIPVIFDQTYQLLKHSVASIIVSGTATLEAALLQVPMVVCYRGSLISYHIARYFIKVRYISLVNLIMGREIVKELIQNDFNRTSVKAELDKLINDQKYRTRMLENLKILRSLLGEPGAAERAADKIHGYIINA